MLTVSLPWPVAALSPNSRDRWGTIKAKKSAKNYAWAVTKAAMPALGVGYRSWAGPIAVHIEFIPAMDRNRDEDNFVAAMKASLDGIASALGVDDSTFRLTHEFLPKEAKSRVDVTLTPAVVDVPVRGQIGDWKSVGSVARKMVTDWK